jgi:N-carbamoylputrescine amidase
MKINVATVQMISNNKDYSGNRLRAEGYICDAVNEGAKLILLPEFALAGYLYTDDFWNMAEPLRGRTYKWQKQVSEKYGVYIGTCILEKDQNNFYDTFLLTGPGQDEEWTHRKIEAPSYESYLFKGVGLNNNVFDTPIGRIGVVICFDSSKAHTLSMLKEKSAEIVLMSFSFPCLPKYFSYNDRKNWIETYLEAPQIYAKLLNVPVVVSNKTGRFSSPVPIGLANFDAEFAGGTSIYDRNGNALEHMTEKQSGILVSEMSLEKRNSLVGHRRFKQKGWLLPYSIKIKVMMEINQKIGMTRYKFSKKRKNALKIEGTADTQQAVSQ